MDNMDYRTWREENFYYTTGWSDAMAAIGAAVAPAINIAADAPFKCYYYTVAVRQGVAGSELLVLNWAGTVQIQDTQIGKNLFNVPAALDGIAGNGQFPYNLAPPRIYASNASAIFTFTANTATRTQVQLTMHGAKLYKI